MIVVFKFSILLAECCISAKTSYIHRDRTNAGAMSIGRRLGVSNVFSCWIYMTLAVKRLNLFIKVTEFSLLQFYTFKDLSSNRNERPKKTTNK